MIGEGVDRTQIVELLKLSPRQRLVRAGLDTEGIGRFLSLARSSLSVSAPEPVASFDPLSAITALVANQVDFVLIGTLAGRILGSPIIAEVVDICPAPDPANASRLVTALRAINAHRLGVENEVTGPLQDGTFTAEENLAFDTDHGPVVCSARSPGPYGYSDLRSTADRFELGDFDIWVASIDDLMRMKKAAGRPKDLIELEVLGALKDELES